jgi:hypothetical protein
VSEPENVFYTREIEGILSWCFERITDDLTSDAKVPVAHALEESDVPLAFPPWHLLFVAMQTSAFQSRAPQKGLESEASTFVKESVINIEKIYLKK